MRVDLLDFPLVTGSAIMVITPIWVASVTFGLLLSTIVTMRGAGICIAVIQKSTGTSAVSNSASLFVVLGINILTLPMKSLCEGK